MKFLKPVKEFVVRNSSTILAVTASLATVATGYFSARAALRVNEIFNDVEEDEVDREFILKKVVPEVIPPVACAVTAIVCGQLGNHIAVETAQKMTAKYVMAVESLNTIRRHLSDEEKERITQEVIEDDDLPPFDPPYDTLDSFSEEKKLWYCDIYPEFFEATEKEVYQMIIDVTRATAGLGFCPIDIFYTDLHLEMPEEMKGYKDPGWNSQYVYDMTWNDGGCPIFDISETAIVDGMEVHIIGMNVLPESNASWYPNNEDDQEVEELAIESYAMNSIVKALKGAK